MSMGLGKKKGMVLGNLGAAFNGLGQLDKAIEFYTKHLNISRELGNRAVCLIKLHFFEQYVYEQEQVDYVIPALENCTAQAAWQWGVLHQRDRVRYKVKTVVNWRAMLVCGRGTCHAQGLLQVY